MAGRRQQVPYRGICLQPLALTCKKYDSHNYFDMASPESNIVSDQTPTSFHELLTHGSIELVIPAGPVDPTNTSPVAFDEARLPQLLAISLVLRLIQSSTSVELNCLDYSYLGLVSRILSPELVTS